MCDLYLTYVSPPRSSERAKEVIRDSGGGDGEGEGEGDGDLDLDALVHKARPRSVLATLSSLSGLSGHKFSLYDAIHLFG